MARPRFNHAALPLPALPNVEGLEFRHAVGLAGYAVDSSGRIWSCKVERCNGYGEWHILSTTATALGRLRVSIRQGRLRKTRLVHHLVAAAFHGPRPDGLNVLHGDGNHTNNRPGNLRYGTQSDNMKDGIQHGTVKPPNRWRFKEPAAT